jgi:hypothetical protein
LGFDAAAAVGRSRSAKASYISSIHLEEIEATVTKDKQQNQKSNWCALKKMTLHQTIQRINNCRYHTCPPPQEFLLLDCTKPAKQKPQGIKIELPYQE